MRNLNKKSLSSSQGAVLTGFHVSSGHFTSAFFAIVVVLVLCFAHLPRAEAITPKEKIALEAIYKLIRERYEGDIQKTFDTFDKNNNGIADFPEVPTLLTASQLDKYFLRKKWINRILKKLDLDKDKAVTVYELQEIGKSYTPFSFKLTEACYDEQCVARSGSPTKHRL